MAWMIGAPGVASSRTSSRSAAICSWSGTASVVVVTPAVPAPLASAAAAIPTVLGDVR